MQPFNLNYIMKTNITIMGLFCSLPLQQQRKTLTRTPRVRAVAPITVFSSGQAISTHFLVLKLEEM